MLVVPAVLIMGPVVVLAVAPHANLYLLFLVPAIAHGHLLTTPRLHGLGTWSYKEAERKKQKIISTSYKIAYRFNTIFHLRCRLLLNNYVNERTYQTYAGHPIQAQILCYPCWVHPSWS